jgi:hypothetical protein
MKHGQELSLFVFHPWLIRLRFLLMLGDDDLVRNVGLPGSEDDDDMLAFVNVRDGGRRELSFSFFAANEFNLSVLVDFEFLLDGRRL